MSDQVLRVGYVPGVTPDKWSRSWRQRDDGVRLELQPLDEDDAEAAVRSGRIDMALARLPVDRTGLHLVRLYDEVPVVVVDREHPVAAYDEIELADLSGEQFVGGPPGGL
ncbi:MAG TPA: LysR substrate-binding domain-containing protein, partial [Microlunatus sp.]|nr:LysR substrate-binding domain-containing protein [Microlunatus sp.]